MTSPVLFHIGYHKTATTWMQKRLFTGGHGYCQIAGHKEVFRHIAQPHGLLFDPAEMRALIDARRPDAGQTPEKTPEKTPVISSEILSGHPFHGGIGSDVYAERIKAIAPDARILISIRNQMRILPSIYMQYLLRGGTQPPARFFAGTDEPGYFGFDPRHFEYDRLVAHYQRLFGRDRVLVVTQEALTSDMDAVAGRIAGFAGNSRFGRLSAEDKAVLAPSYPEYAVPVLRRINHVQTSTLSPTPILSVGHTPLGLYKLAGYVLRLRPFRALLSHRHPVRDCVSRKFDGSFRESNRRLRALVDGRTDLSRYET